MHIFFPCSKNNVHNMERFSFSTLKDLVFLHMDVKQIPHISAQLCDAVNNTNPENRRGYVKAEFKIKGIKLKLKRTSSLH